MSGVEAGGVATLRRDDGERVSPSVVDVRDQLKRILASSAFLANLQRKALLRYLVDEMLAGRSTGLKSFSIAMAVFGLEDTIEARVDPLVRLQVLRLRRELAIYYRTVGTADPVQITIPKGGYVPCFAWRSGNRATMAGDGVQAAGKIGSGSIIEAPWASVAEATEHCPEKASARGYRSAVFYASLCVAILIAAVGGWIGNWHQGGTAVTPSTQAQEHGATVIVLPFQALSPTADDNYLAVGLAHDLISELMQFSGLTLYSVPSSLRQSPTTDPAKIARDLPVAYVVNGNVRSDEGRVRVGVELFDAQSSQVLWSETYDRPLTPSNLLEAQERLATQIATRLGQPYGIVRSSIAKRISKGQPQTMTAYGCVLQAYSYRRTFSREQYAPIRACLEEAVRLDPTYADAWALLGWFQLDAARFGYVPPARVASEFDRALASARHSVELSPRNLLSLQALSTITYYHGDDAEAERIQRQALALNPNDPETLAQLGWRLAVHGRWDEGLGYLTQALSRSVDPPPWYYFSFAMHDFLVGKYDAALAMATKPGATNWASAGHSMPVSRRNLGIERKRQKRSKKRRCDPPRWPVTPPRGTACTGSTKPSSSASSRACARPAGLRRIPRSPPPNESVCGLTLHSADSAKRHVWRGRLLSQTEFGIPSCRDDREWR